MTHFEKLKLYILTDNYKEFTNLILKKDFTHNKSYLLRYSAYYNKEEFVKFLCNNGASYKANYYETIKHCVINDNYNLVDFFISLITNSKNISINHLELWLQENGYYNNTRKNKEIKQYMLKKLKKT